MPPEIETEPISDLQPVPGTDVVFRSLVKTLGLLKRAMEPFFARFGISGSQWAVLRHLQRAEQAGQAELRLTDLSERLLIRPPSVSGVVDRLQRTGLVTCQASSTDQRAKHVKLAPAGRKLIETVHEQHAARIARILTALEPAEQNQLHDYLERLGSHLEALLESDQP